MCRFVQEEKLLKLPATKEAPTLFVVTKQHAMKQPQESCCAGDMFLLNVCFVRTHIIKVTLCKIFRIIQLILRAFVSVCRYMEQWQGWCSAFVCPYLKIDCIRDVGKHQD